MKKGKKENAGKRFCRQFAECQLHKHSAFQKIPNNNKKATSKISANFPII